MLKAQQSFAYVTAHETERAAGSDAHSKPVERKSGPDRIARKVFFYTLAYVVVVIASIVAFIRPT